MCPGNGGQKSGVHLGESHSRIGPSCILGNWPVEFAGMSMRATALAFWRMLSAGDGGMGGTLLRCYLTYRGRSVHRGGRSVSRDHAASSMGEANPSAA